MSKQTMTYIKNMQEKQIAAARRFTLEKKTAGSFLGRNSL